MLLLIKLVSSFLVMVMVMDLTSSTVVISSKMFDKTKIQDELQIF